MNYTTVYKTTHENSMSYEGITVTAVLVSLDLQAPYTLSLTTPIGTFHNTREFESHGEALHEGCRFGRKVLKHIAEHHAFLDKAHAS